MSFARTFNRKLYYSTLTGSCCSNVSGTVQAACFYGGYVFVSTNSGVTWTQTSAPLANWRGICANADGTILYACAFNGSVWKSTNTGSTWTELTSLGTRKWYGICCDDGGTNALVTCFNDAAKICIITSTGSSFPTPANNNFTQGFRHCCCSADFTKLYVCCDTGEFYKSTNSGSTWTQIYTADSLNRPFTSVCCSSDGTYVYLCIYNSYTSAFGVLNSSDSGTTFGFFANSARWHFICCNRTGDTVAVCANNERIYIKTTTVGDTWISYGNILSYNNVSLTNKNSSGKNVNLITSGVDFVTLSETVATSFNINNISNGIPTGFISSFIGTTNSADNTTSNDPPGWIIANGLVRTNGSDGKYNNLINLGIGVGVLNGNYTPIDLRASMMRGIGDQTYNNVFSVNYDGPANLNTFVSQRMITHNHTASLAAHTHDLKVSISGTEYDITGGGNYNSTGTNAAPKFGLFAINGLDTNDGYDQTTGELNLVVVEAMNVGSATPTITINNNSSNTGSNIYPVNYGVHWIIKL